jgi:2-polyprenyl-3-methyl-5-hydroxy-6-metoxy-1,4-benzoquinol methylase
MDSTPLWKQLLSSQSTHYHSLPHDFVPTQLLSLIRNKPSLILDVGCFCGATGAHLKKTYPDARVIGIEPITEAATQARQHLDVVLNGKFEEVNLADAGINKHSIDVVVLADVLEHMYNPWHTLSLLKEWLSPTGVVIASIPNMRNLALISELIQGDFSYAGSGLRDITHIRFFTMATIQKMFAGTGYAITEVDLVIDAQCAFLLDGLNNPPPTNIDIKVAQLKNLTHADLQELATLQFLICARANDS